MIENKLAQLSRIFHSEADFQHALAWKLHQHHQDAMIRLEKRVEPSTAADHLEELYVDLWFKPEETPIPIELKLPCFAAD